MVRMGAFNTTRSISTPYCSRYTPVCLEEQQKFSKDGSLKLLDFYQKRLMLFVLNETDGSPLRNIPLYGEVSIYDPNHTSDHSSFLGHSGSLDGIKRRVHPALLEIILSIIEVQVDFGWIRRMADRPNSIP